MPWPMTQSFSRLEKGRKGKEGVGRWRWRSGNGGEILRGCWCLLSLTIAMSSSSSSSSLCVCLYFITCMELSSLKAAESEGKRKHVRISDGVGGLTRVAEIRGLGLYNIYVYI